jgi:hypothetical protein
MSRVERLELRLDDDVAPTPCVKCPHCGEANLHPDFSEVQIEVEKEYTSPLGNRGAWLAFPIDCETCSGATRFVVGFHKGHLWIGVAEGDPTRVPWWKQPSFLEEQS